MSKLVTTRYELVVYDDATGALTAVPPTYPTVLDTFVMDNIVSAAQSYGIINVSGTGQQSILAPPGATLTVLAPLSNTTNVNLKTANTVQMLPGGALNSVPNFTVMPGQTVTFPGVWNVAGNTVICLPVDSTNSATTAAFNLQILWSL